MFKGTAGLAGEEKRGKEGHAFLPAPQGVERRKRKCHWRKVVEEKGDLLQMKMGALRLGEKGE